MKLVQNITTTQFSCFVPSYNSSAELAEQNPDIPSGNSWILNSTQSPVQVFCEMGDEFPSSLNVTGGWVRIANLNMTDPDQHYLSSLGNFNMIYCPWPYGATLKHIPKGWTVATHQPGLFIVYYKFLHSQ